MTNRLDNVLQRNRKNLLIDLALAALFPMALLLSGMAVGAELPKLASAPQVAPAIIAQADSADV